MKFSQKLVLTLSLITATAPVCAMENNAPDPIMSKVALVAGCALLGGFFYQISIGQSVHLKKKWHRIIHDYRLYDAVKDGNLEKIEALLKEGADINAVLPCCHTHETEFLEGVDYDYTTPLETSFFETGNINVSELLVKYGEVPANILRRIDGGSLLSLVLKHGADIQRTVDLNEGRWFGAPREIPLYAQMIDNAVTHGSLKTFLENAYFTQKTKSTKETQDRVLATCHVLKRLGMSSDITRRIALEVPAPNVISKEHCRLLLNNGTNLGLIIERCPIVWLQQIYESSDAQGKKAFLQNIVPAIIDYRLECLQRMLNNEYVQDIALNATPTIQTMLDPDNVEQHREAITKNVKELFPTKINYSPEL